MRAIQETASLPSEVSPRERVSRLQRLTIVWLTVLTALLILFGWRQGTSPPGRPEIASAQGALGTSARPVVPSDVSVADGPWGRLEIVPITICPPAEYLDERMESYVAPVVWYFPGIDSSELSDLLLRLGLPSSLIDQLMSDTEWDESIQGCAVFPDREVVLGLTAEVRTRLYLMLHEFAENKDHCNSYQFCGESVDQWIGDAPVLPSTRDLIRPMVYRHGRFMFFSDLRSVLPLLPSDQERLSLMRALMCESTLLVRLKVPAESDVEQLVMYWSRGGRSLQVRPILESLSKLPGEQSLDVTQLLPHFARERIYTYPVVSGKANTSISRDCHWTTFNFFAEDRPDDRYGDPKQNFATFGDDYHQIFGNLQLGDVVVYIDGKGEVVHTAIHIASDIVFTKNGSSIVHPWMLMRLSDLDDYYPRQEGLSRGFYRRNGY